MDMAEICSPSLELFALVAEIGGGDSPAEHQVVPVMGGSGSGGVVGGDGSADVLGMLDPSWVANLFENGFSYDDVELPSPLASPGCLEGQQQGLQGSPLASSWTDSFSDSDSSSDLVTVPTHGRPRGCKRRAANKNKYNADELAVLQLVPRDVLRGPRDEYRRRKVAAQLSKAQKALLSKMRRRELSCVYANNARRDRNSKMEQTSQRLATLTQRNSHLEDENASLRDQLLLLQSRLAVH